MAQIKITTDYFNMVSTWKCAKSGSSYVISSGPSTAQKVVTFAYSLPAGARVNFVRVYATIGSPNTGAAVKTANGVNLAGNYMSVCCAEQDLSTFDASASSYVVTFKFKAYGAVYSDTNEHAGTLSFTDVYLLIDYSIPTSSWSISATEVDAGGSVTVNVQPQDAGCSHTLAVKFGSISQNYTIAAGVTSYALSIPLSWLTQIPRSVSGNATLQLTTILDGAVLGSSDTKNLTIKCPESVVPTIGNITINTVDPVWGLCVQGHSKIEVIITNSQGVYGSEIVYGDVVASPTLGTGFYNYNQNNEISLLSVDVIKASGVITLTITATDSRGRKASTQRTLTVQAYDGPSIIQTVQGRANSAGTPDAQGKYIYAGVEYSYAAIATNAPLVRIYYRADNTEVWTLGYEGALGSGASVCFGGSLDTSTVYELQYVVSDDLLSTVVIRTIGTAYAFMKWQPQKNAIGFGCVPRGANMVEVSADWRLFANGKDVEAYAPIRNCVDNGYFLHAVNQRAYDEAVYPYELTVMYIDRWEITGSGESFINCIDGTGVLMQGVSATNYIEMRQRFEDYANMAGQEFTLHCCIDEVEYCYSFVMGACTTGHAMGNLTFFSTESAHIAFRNSTANQVTFAWVALYKGALSSERLPQYVPKGFGVELAECARYFMRIGTQRLNWIAAQAYGGLYMSTTTVRVTVPGINVLRATPTVMYGMWDTDMSLEDGPLALYNAAGVQVPITEAKYMPNENGGVELLLQVGETAAGASYTPATLLIMYAVHLSADV